MFFFSLFWFSCMCCLMLNWYLYLLIVMKYILVLLIWNFLFGVKICLMLLVMVVSGVLFFLFFRVIWILFLNLFFVLKWLVYLFFLIIKFVFVLYFGGIVIWLFMDYMSFFLNVLFLDLVNFSLFLNLVLVLMMGFGGVNFRFML